MGNGFVDKHNTAPGRERPDGGCRVADPRPQTAGIPQLKLGEARSATRLDSLVHLPQGGWRGARTPYGAQASAGAVIRTRAAQEPTKRTTATHRGDWWTIVPAPARLGRPSASHRSRKRVTELPWDLAGVAPAREPSRHRRLPREPGCSRRLPLPRDGRLRRQPPHSRASRLQRGDDDHAVRLVASDRLPVGVELARCAFRTQKTTAASPSSR
jgi:hypothetical protein